MEDGYGPSFSRDRQFLLHKHFSSLLVSSHILPRGARQIQSKALSLSLRSDGSCRPGRPLCHPESAPFQSISRLLPTVGKAPSAGSSRTARVALPAGRRGPGSHLLSALNNLHGIGQSLWPLSLFSAKFAEKYRHCLFSKEPPARSILPFRLHPATPNFALRCFQTLSHTSLAFSVSKPEGLYSEGRLPFLHGRFYFYFFLQRASPCPAASRSRLGATPHPGCPVHGWSWPTGTSQWRPPEMPVARGFISE